MDRRYAKFLRWLTVGSALILLMISGHCWNKSRVHPDIVVWFDMMLLLLSVCVLGMVMWDAGDRERNIRAALFLCAGILSVLFVYSSI